MFKRVAGISALALFVCSVLLLSGCSFDRGQTKAATTLSATETEPEIKEALIAVERFPEMAAVYNQLAVAHIKHARKSGDFGSYSKAETAVDKALAISADDSTARKLKASLSLTFHRFEQALEQGRALTVENPREAFGFGVLTDAYVELGRYDEAVTAVQQMVDLRPDSSSYARVANVRTIFGDVKGAEEMYKLAARTADPADREAQSWSLVQLGNLYFGVGNYDGAERIYDEALANLPDYHLGATGKAKARAARNDLDAAAEILKREVSRIPEVESVILLGDIYAKKGDAEAAKTQYQLAEAMETRFGPNADKRRLALMWADSGTNLEQALAIANAEKSTKNDIYTETVLGWCLYKNSRYAEAREAMTRAAKTKKLDARILFQTGMIEAALGNRASGIAFLEKALKLNPSFDLIQSGVAREKLAELKGGRS